MNQEQLQRRIELAGPKKQSMARRKQDHDYQSRRMYMITMTTEGRQPIFGTVVGDPRLPFGNEEAPRTVPSPLGQAITACWYEIEKRNDDISVIAFQLMPDHFHGILFVKEHIDKHLGTILNGFKTGCRKAFRTLCPVEYAVALRRQTQRRGRHDDDHGILFAPGYNDKILLRIPGAFW